MASIESPSVLCTPTKRPRSPSDSELDPQSSPVFIKPADLFRSRMRQKAQKTSPTSSTGGAKRCTLQTIVQKKNYSPLKCLMYKSPKKFNQSNVADSEKSPRKRVITFSPLMKKLQRSPARSALQFPVVKRGAFNSTNSGTLNKRPLNNSFNRVLDFSEEANFFPDRFGNSPSKSCNTESNSGSGAKSYYPLNAPNIDWSLKTKLRLTSNRSIPFNGTFKAIDEATGLNGFVHGAQANTEMDCANFSAELNRHCMVWQHPSIPWITLYPRLPDLKPGSTLVGSTTPVFTIAPNSTMADSLHSAFCTSLHSLFQLLKLKHCPYFYLCANNFIALFRAQGVAGSNFPHALITPTTTGLRKLLEEEGITYTMPFHPNHSNSSSSTSSLTSLSNSQFSLTEESSDSSSGISSESSHLSPLTENRKEEEVIDLDDDEAYPVNVEENEMWLESLGLSQQDFPSLESLTLRRRQRMKSKSGTTCGKPGGVNDDQTAEGRVKSLIRVDGVPDCTALLQLFMNQRKICIANSGPLSGIPPTLLSPVAFYGGTLTPLKVHYRASEPVRNQTLYSIDVNGPILPHTLHGLTSLYGRFCANFVGGTPPTLIRGMTRTLDQSGSFALEAGLQQQQQFPIIIKRSNAPSKLTTPVASTAASLISNTTELQVNPMFEAENMQETGMEKRFLTAICVSARQLTQPIVDFEVTTNGIRYNRTVQINSRQTTTTSRR